MSTNTDNTPAEASEAQPQPLPLLAREDKDFLLFFLTLNEDPIAAAEKSGVNFVDIIAWTTLPHIAAYLAHVRMLRIQRQRDLALFNLEQILKTTDDNTERRRAATTILRATDPRRLWHRPRKHSITHHNAGAAPHTSEEHPEPITTENGSHRSPPKTTTPIAPHQQLPPAEDRQRRVATSSTAAGSSHSPPQTTTAVASHPQSSPTKDEQRYGAASSPGDRTRASSPTHHASTNKTPAAAQHPREPPVQDKAHSPPS